MADEWRMIPGWEGFYEVSERGQVRSVARDVCHPRGGVHHRKPRALKGYLDHKGYRGYALHRDGVMTRKGAHVLVAMAFLDGEGPVVRHLNGDHSENHYTNLAYGTYSENTLDSVDHGTHYRASKTMCANGHPYTDASTLRVGPDKRWRKCRICVREQRLRWIRKKREL